MARQQRVDASHPLDLYADFEPPDRPGLVLVTSVRPPDRFPARSIELDVGQRSDGRWTLRMTLEVPALMGVFAELCRDIIESTRKGVPDAEAGATFIDRIASWRRLLDRGPVDLSPSAIRGLIGELTVLREIVLPVLTPPEAVASWTGPYGTPQDFMLPSGLRLEVKAVGANKDSVRINGLEQLDPGEDPLKLMVVRLEATAAGAPNAVTLDVVIERIRKAVAGSSDAQEQLELLLSFAGWKAEKDQGGLVFRIKCIDGYDVGDGFPRLIKTTVPDGVAEASYTVRLPKPTEQWMPDRWT
jgi:hypothetical protein